MTIQNLDRFIESITDWSILAGCFGQTTISPSDIDGFVERRGTCLFLEGKAPGVWLKTGQAIAYQTLAKQGNAVIVFWGSGKEVCSMRIITKSDPGEKKAASLYDLRRAVSGWFAKADGKAAP